MAEPEVEAAWRAEFERSGVKELRDALSADGLTDELKRQAAFRWLGDEAEAQRLQQEQTYHYVRWTFLVAVAAVIAGRQPSRCFTPRARCIDNPQKVLGPTDLRPKRYSLQTKLGITPYGDTLRSRGLLG